MNKLTIPAILTATVLVAAVLVAGILTYLPFRQAEAGNIIQITGTTGNDNIQIFEEFGIICVSANVIVTGAGPSVFCGGGLPQKFDITNEKGVDTNYKVKGNGGTDTIQIRDGSTSDDDKYKFMGGKGGTDRFTVSDGAGNDEYIGKEIEEFIFTDDAGDGGDKIDIN